MAKVIKNEICWCDADSGEMVNEEQKTFSVSTGIWLKFELDKYMLAPIENDNIDIFENEEFKAVIKKVDSKEFAEHIEKFFE